MRHLGFAAGLWAAIKADTLSLIAWQVGIYAFMAFARYILLGHLLHVTLVSGSARFWFVMQWAMLAGFATSYPVNAWLLKSGIKEPM